MEPSNEIYTYSLQILDLTGVLKRVKLHAR
jgi:hypothetical protein